MFQLSPSIKTSSKIRSENIITVEFDIDERLTKILHNITINIVILTNFSIFETFIKKEIQRYLSTNILLM